MNSSENQKFAIATARSKYQMALDLLHESVDILRSDEIDASPSAMKLEKALTRAIETLSYSGFHIE